MAGQITTGLIEGDQQIVHSLPGILNAHPPESKDAGTIVIQ